MVADPGRPSLLLTVTRRCNLRCAYCPTVKEGLPDLSPADALRALRLFEQLYGGGDCKLFGGEPMLARDAVEAVVEAAPPGVQVYLSTNGMFLDDRLFSMLERHPRTILTLSLDGEAATHDGLRRMDGAAGPSHAAILKALPRLLAYPRFVVTQTIAPSAAKVAAQNFRYLRSLGIRRFNLLPGYYLPWRPEQLAALAAAFAEIEAEFVQAWASGEYLYLRNLYTRAPTPFFNSGMVVDVDGSIHPSNLILAGTWEDLRGYTAVGSLDQPPRREALALAARQSGAQIRARLAPTVAESTDTVDALLTALCNRLYPAYFRFREHRKAA